MKSLSVKLGVILIVFIIFSCAEVWGENWKVLGGTKDENMEFYYDAQSVVRYGAIVKVWQKQVDKKEFFSTNPQVIFEALFLIEIDCGNRSYRVLKIVYHHKGGDITEVPSARIPLEAMSPDLRDAFINKQFIIPQTPQEELCKSVCK